jgi:cytochrome P450
VTTTPETKPAYAPVFEFDREALRCPFQHFDAAREEAPISWYTDGNFWVVTSYELASEVLNNNTEFSAEQCIGEKADAVWTRMIELARDNPETAHRIEGYGAGARRVLLFSDPPVHTRHRRIINRALTPTAVRRSADHMRRIARGLLDDVAARGEDVDFVETFAEPYPMAVISAVLGLPAEDRTKLRGWVTDLNSMIATEDMSDDNIRELSKTRFNFDDYFHAAAEDRMQNPTDDLTSMVVHENEKSPEKMSRDDLMMVYQLLIVGGADTSDAAMSRMLEDLATHPETYARLRREPELIPNYIEGMLRVAGPALGIFRRARADIEIGGQQIKNGDFVWLSFAGANYDKSAYGLTADTVDLDEDQTTRHMTFGWGPHLCIGAPLARQEMKVALEEITDRFSAIELAPDAEYPPAYRPSFLFHGPATIRLRFTEDPDRGSRPVRSGP